VTVTATETPAVLAVLVTHDGATWLPTALDALAAQHYPALDIVAVDNASQDGSRELLLDRLGEERVLLADRDLGFGAAVSMALDARAATVAPYVLLVHDDVALAPDAIAALVRAMETDPRLAAAGTKLRSWEAGGTLQSVGWTIDLTGRADSGVDPGELDQGQRDQERRSLYVSTAGMLVRRDVFDSLGRFDRRYHLFRDDLDLCWRLWLHGHEVEIVPDAVAEHAAGATNYVRLGQTRFIGPRYFAERNTLATLLKNYGPLRLLVVIPLYVLVGVAKVVGFLLTRRVSDAWQTVRAWVWNLLHLRETRRLRRQVQQERSRTDAELAPLFGRIGPRVRAYAEAMASWVTGGDVDPAPEPAHTDVPEPQEGALARLGSAVRRRPVLLTGLVLLVLLVAGTWPLLLPGELRGGELAPWPASPGAFLRDYASGWHEAGAFGTAAAPSPSQALLGLWHGLLGGNAYLASRGLLLVPVLVGFLLALRAAQAYSKRRVPRVAAAVAYVLSPPAVAAILTGRIGALVVLAVLPGIVAAGITMARRRVAVARAWRAVAAIALLTSIGGAFEPLLVVGVVLAGALVALLIALATSQPAWRASVLARFGVAVVAPVVLLLPWSWELLADGGPLGPAGVADPVGGELWRWLVLSPELAGFPGLLAGAGFVLAGLLGLVLGVRRRPLFVAALWLAALAGGIGGWWLDRAGYATWAGLPLLVAAAAYAGLLALAFATGEAQLRTHAFGWRQLAVAVTSLAVATSLVAVAVALVGDELGAYRVAEPSLPSFLTAEVDEVGDFRVVVLAVEGDEVAWDVVDGRGPTMAATGVPPVPVALDEVQVALDAMLERSDPAAVDRLGAIGVRYLYVPPGGEAQALDTALAAQQGLEPRAIAEGRLARVAAWLPADAAIDRDSLARLDAGRGLADDALIVPLDDEEEGGLSGEVPDGSTVVVTEVDDGQWELEAGRETLSVDPEHAFVRFVDVPGGPVTVTHTGGAARSLAVTGQVLAVLLAISLALRPPGFARRLAVEDPVREPDALPPVTADVAAVSAEAPPADEREAILAGGPGRDGDLAPDGEGPAEDASRDDTREDVPGDAARPEEGS
jgi:GT2 family glycosyltransferase